MGEEQPFHEIPDTRTPHYHGDAVRILFVIAAGLAFLAEMLDGNLPFPAAITVVMVIVLVVAAGITNPVQQWIHWFNMAISVLGLMIFGGLALTRFKNDAPFSESFIVGCLAVVFLLSLYLATRTVRGLMMHKVRS